MVGSSYLRVCFALGAMAMSSWVHGAVAQSKGPDVIIAEVGSLSSFGFTDTHTGIYVDTVACNAGNQVIQWHSLKDTDPDRRKDHPLIAQNMYMLANNGVLRQIGQSGVKHGFGAEQAGGCPWQCKANPDHSALGIGCSDRYRGYMIGAGYDTYVGPRSAVDPSTGDFDIANAIRKNIDSSGNPDPLGWALQVSTNNLGVAGARYFVEAVYIAADDAKAKNATNNVSYAEVHVGGFPTKWSFPTDKTKIGCPAISAWSNARLTTFDMDGDGRLIVAVAPTKLASAKYRVEIAVFNMNSALGVRAVHVPITSAMVAPGSIGFYSPPVPGESYANDSWAFSAQGDEVAWSTKIASEDPNANALRWAQMFNFWFEVNANTAPVIKEIAVQTYKGDQTLRRIPITGSFRCDPNRYR